MKSSFKLLDKLSWDEETKENESNQNLPWVGISDTALQNAAYKKLLSEMKIASTEIEELLLLIEGLLNNKFNISGTISQIVHPTMPFDQQNLNKVVDFMNIDMRIILMWKMNKYSINSIVLKSCTSKGLVYKSSSKYKRGVLNLWKVNKTAIIN